MIYPNKGFFQRILESAVMFALVCWLVRTGICMIQSVWGWIMLLTALTGIVIVGVRFYKYYKGSKF